MKNILKLKSTIANNGIAILILVTPPVTLAVTIIYFALTYGTNASIGF